MFFVPMKMKFEKIMAFLVQQPNRDEQNQTLCQAFAPKVMLQAVGAAP